MNFCKTMSETICKYIYCIIASLIVVGVIIYIAVSGHSLDWTYYFNESFATWSYIAIILSAFFVGWQALLFRKDYKHKKNREEFDKSYELAHYYAKEILPHISAITMFLDKMGIPIKNYEYIKKSMQFHDFTINEAYNIFGKDQVEKYKHELIKPIPNTILVQFFSAYYGKTRWEISESWNSIVNEFDKNKRKEFYQDLNKQVYACISNTINDLEYFSMYFCSEVATSDKIYMSLHQTFIEFTNDVYILIAIKNKYSGHELYTHVIDLHNTWMEILNEQNEKFLEIQKRIKELEKEGKKLSRSIHSKPKKM